MFVPGIRSQRCAQCNDRSEFCEAGKWAGWRVGLLTAGGDRPALRSGS